MNDSPEYLEKKAFFDSLITLYGRNVAVEVLRDDTLEIHKLHLSKSNRSDETIEEILSCADAGNRDQIPHERGIVANFEKQRAGSRGSD